MTKAEFIIAEIGSTITKVSAFAGISTPTPRFLGQGISLTTVKEGDVKIGFERAKQRLEEESSIDTKSAEFMASASAAGGLRMSVHGLTRDMTLRAAREASLGAGANLVYTTAGIISDDDLNDIVASSPNLILLAGGIDYGDREVVLANARKIAGSASFAPVIYAGNRSVASVIRRIFNNTGKTLWVVDNVYPAIDELNVKPVRDIIHEVFSRHIVNAPGMEKIKTLLTGDVIPTPGAVLKAAELLYKEMGDLVTVDVGGATTDIHSVTAGSRTFSAMRIAPEPFSKRTVEGDLGVFLNARRVEEASGTRLQGIEQLKSIPETEDEKAVTLELTRLAAGLALWRHAGELKVAYGAFGRNELVDGRDLTAVRSIIGTGGALTRLGGGEEILSSIKRDPARRKLLPKEDARIFLDRDYIMASAGVLSHKAPEAALNLLLASLKISARSRV
ncbi:MAG: glutamate mutase L [Spirochaetota bacterium]